MGIVKDDLMAKYGELSLELMAERKKQENLHVAEAQCVYEITALTPSIQRELNTIYKGLSESHARCAHILVKMQDISDILRGMEDENESD